MELISKIIGSRRAFFSLTEEGGNDEKIIEIEIERLRSFKNHPFQVKEDNEILSKYWMVKMDMR